MFLESKVEENLLKDWHKENLRLKASKKIRFSRKFRKSFDEFELKLVEDSF